MNRKRIVAVLVTLGLAFGFLGWQSYQAEQYGSVKLEYSTADVFGAAIKIDGDTASTSTQVYRLGKGEHVISVTKQGYKAFTKNFTITPKKQVVIYIPMTLDSDPTIRSLSQISGLAIDASNVQIQSVQYYYSQTWAIVMLASSSGDAAAVIASYSPASKTWTTIAGPGTAFTEGDLGGVPSIVKKNVTVLSETEAQ